MLLEGLKQIVGTGGYVEEKIATAPYATPWREASQGHTPLVLFPSSTEQVSDIMRHCYEHHIAVIPQGGNTGLVGGTRPEGEVIINLTRMKTVRSIDTLTNCMVVEAGCVLATVQETALQHQRLFPLSMASEGSCTIGGTMATNAGGINVLRYGTARALCMGLEVVLANGDVLNTLSALRKDNVGYDLRQLFIGSEGTLGIITAVSLALFPIHQQRETAWIAFNSLTDAVQLLHSIHADIGETLIAFEWISHHAMHAVVNTLGVRHPLHAPSAIGYVLLECASNAKGHDIRQKLEKTILNALENGIVCDAVIAETLAHRNEFWKIRESISEVEKFLGVGLHYDVSLPISKISAFINSTNEAIQQIYPSLIPLIFGHLGDGNIHYNWVIPHAELMRDNVCSTSIDHHTKQIVYRALLTYNGSMSAEHGVGLTRREDMLHMKDTVAISLMRALKKMLDPFNLLNPNKLIAQE